ncbi:Uncharacterized protein dnm_060920 [Desulfonema magnum]|uniref:Uncharacterized protein n=1 Tax=Desulfonema magnum TaxID=45655 RepID=A0A975BRD3_9BACT|nr:Uncharacterized protein dnm_060920 [Desulfonema magnum]
MHFGNISEALPKLHFGTPDRTKSAKVQLCHSGPNEICQSATLALRTERNLNVSVFFLTPDT